MRRNRNNFESQRYVAPQMVPLVYRMPYGINPAPKPAQFIQLTPVSLPVAINPYITESQPLAVYDASVDPNNY